MLVYSKFVLLRQTDRPDRGEPGWNLKVEDWHDVMVEVYQYNYQYCARSSGNRFSLVGKVLEVLIICKIILPANNPSTRRIFPWHFHEERQLLKWEGGGMIYERPNTKYDD